MLGESQRVEFNKVGLEAAQQFVSNGFESAIGHADTATVVSGILGTDVPMNRISVSLEGEWKILVAQYSGPRLQEGAKSLPEGATIQFWIVCPVNEEEEEEEEMRKHLPNEACPSCGDYRLVEFADEIVCEGCGWYATKGKGF